MFFCFFAADMKGSGWYTETQGIGNSDSTKQLYHRANETA